MANARILSALIDQSPHGHLVLDSQWKITLWNSWMQEATGILATRAIGMSFKELFVQQELAPRLMTAIRSALESGSSSRLSWAFNPHPFPIMHPTDPDKCMVQSVCVSSYGESKEGRVCMIVVEDHTPDYEREALLIERSGELKRVNASLEEKNHHLDEFTWQASHDLQEPLRKVEAFTDLLIQDLGSDLNADAVSDIRIIKDAVHRMGAMVEGLLMLSRAGSEVLRLTEGSMSETVKGALSALDLRIRQTQACIQVPHLPSVPADHRLIGLVFQNLISNAMKFCQASTPQLSITHEVQGGKSVFGVKDNGIGINPNHSTEIFEPFKRLHGRSEFQGSGIGLSICQRAVLRHGGRIWVESSPGAGSHFKFVLSAAA